MVYCYIKSYGTYTVILNPISYTYLLLYSLTAVQPGQPQIYQYTDAVTGQVSYVDANGQQYLDPNNPQHQQLLMQQTNPQYLQQQATKSNIISLYNQPQQTGQTRQAAQPQMGQPQVGIQQTGQPQMSMQQTGQPQMGIQQTGQPQMGIQQTGQIGQMQMGQMQAGVQPAAQQYPASLGQPQAMQQTQMYGQMTGQPQQFGFPSQATGFGQYNQTYQPFR